MKATKIFRVHRRAVAQGKGPIGRVVRFVRHDIWMLNVEKLGRVPAYFTRLARVLFITVRGFVRDRCMQQAAALTYLTIFTLPAFLALVFSVAKGLGAFDRLKLEVIDPFLASAFPDGDGDAATEGSARIRALADQIFAYVENAELGVLGTAGVVFLVYATFKMLSSVEKSFNEIWGVASPRTWTRKLSDYLAIVLVIPVVLLIGTAFTGYLSSAEVSGAAAKLELRGPILAAVPITAICLGMTLVVMVLPNTRVKIVPALLGGILAGVSWQIAQVAFLASQLGLARVNAVFSSFAAVPLLLMWIYLSWVIIFAGAELSFAVQNEDVITSIARTGVVDQRFKEAVAPRLAGRITAAFLAGEQPPDAATLAHDLGLSPRAVTMVLEPLVQQRMLVEALDDDHQGYLPARDPGTITVVDLLLALRVQEGRNSVPSTTKLDERVDRILDGFEQELRGSLNNYSLTELAQTRQEDEEPGTAPIEASAQPRAAEHPS